MDAETGLYKPSSEPEKAPPSAEDAPMANSELSRGLFALRLTPMNSPPLFGASR